MNDSFGLFYQKMEFIGKLHLMPFLQVDSQDDQRVQKCCKNSALINYISSSLKSICSFRNHLVFMFTESSHVVESSKKILSCCYFYQIENLPKRQICPLNCSLLASYSYSFISHTIQNENQFDISISIVLKVIRMLAFFSNSS